jgi:SH3 domain protein
MSGKFLISLSLLLMPVFALALDFKSVAEPKAILYDGPSAAANKRFIVSQFYPVEVVVKLSNWVKVRDAEGGLFWIESKALSNLRTVLIQSETAELHQTPSATSTVLALVEKQVVFILEDEHATNGWLKVRTVQGDLGYLPINAVWGF